MKFSGQFFRLTSLCKDYIKFMQCKLTVMPDRLLSLLQQHTADFHYICST